MWERHGRRRECHCAQVRLFGDLNVPNRRMRTRMSGGVGGLQERPTLLLPIPIGVSAVEAHVMRTGLTSMRLRVILGFVAVFGILGSGYAAIVQATTLPIAANGFWQRSESAHFEVFAPRGLGVPPALADSLESALSDVRAQFPVKGRGPRVIVAASRTHAAALNGGQRVAGMYLPDTHTIVLVRSVVNPVLLRHELAHSETAALWGPPHAGAAWLVEGIANLAGSACGTTPPRSIAAMHLDTGRLPRLPRVLEDFRAIPEIEGYPAAGSLVELLMARGDSAQLAAIWRGAPVEVAEAEWHAFLRGAPKVFSTPRADCSARGA